MADDITEDQSRIPTAQGIGGVAASPEEEELIRSYKEKPSPEEIKAKEKSDVERLHQKQEQIKALENAGIKDATYDTYVKEARSLEKDLRSRGVNLGGQEVPEQQAQQGAGQ